MTSGALVEDKKAFWRFRQAQQCFEYAAKTSAYVLNEKWQDDHPLIYEISLAVVVLYSRPFSNCYGIGKLDEKIVPRELFPRHKRMLAMRDRVFAHHDVTASDDPTISDLFAEVRLNLLGPQPVVEISEITLKDVAFGQIQELAERLEKKCIWHLYRLCRKYKKLLPRNPGIYHLDLSDTPDEFFSRRA